MARTNDVWETGVGGTYIQTIGSPNGYNLLINGTNHYINFNSIVGASGYGIRDNGGTMEFKNSGGAWTAFGSGGGSIIIDTTVITGGADKEILFNKAGVVSGATTIEFDYTNVQFKIGVPTVLDGSSLNPISIGGNMNTYFATYVQNKSSGGSASADVTAGNDIDDGTLSTGHYIDMGVSSSTYNDSGFTMSGANDGYLYTIGANLLIGTGTANMSIKFFIGGLASSTEKMRLTPTGLGIYTTNPLTGLEVAEQTTGAVRGILTGQYSTGTTSSRIIWRKARGTITSPTTIVTGDFLGSLIFEGYDGSGYLQMGQILVGSEGTIGTNRVPTFMRFSTATNAATSVLTTAMTIDSSQIVTIAKNLIISTPLNTTGNAVTVDGTQTLSNKIVQKRVLVVTQSATPATNIDNADIVSITALAQAITNLSTNLTGTPYNGQIIEWQITGTAGRAITYGVLFGSSGTVTLPSATVSTTMLTFWTQYDSASALHVCKGVA